MNGPKYKVGDDVLYRTLNKRGVVVKCINENDVDDLEDHGYRYYVDVDGAVFSVPEKTLLYQGKKS